MDICADCNIYDKIEYCCFRNPETRKSKYLKIGKNKIPTCISLNRRGYCSDYPNRPHACKEYQCHKFYEESDLTRYY